MFSSFAKLSVFETNCVCFSRFFFFRLNWVWFRDSEVMHYRQEVINGKTKKFLLVSCLLLICYWQNKGIYFNYILLKKKWKYDSSITQIILRTFNQGNIFLSIALDSGVFSHNARSFVQFYFLKTFSGKSFNLKAWFIDDYLLHFIILHYANHDVLTSVLQEKREVYFIYCYAKLLFFTCLFTESNAAIYAKKISLCE